MYITFAKNDRVINKCLWRWCKIRADLGTGTLSHFKQNEANRNSTVNVLHHKPNVITNHRKEYKLDSHIRTDTQVFREDVLRSKSEKLGGDC